MASEKEFNGNLFDQLSIIERLERAHKSGTFEEEVKILKGEIERKLYQQPPLANNEK